MNYAASSSFEMVLDLLHARQAIRVLSNGCN